MKALWEKTDGLKQKEKNILSFTEKRHQYFVLSNFC